jgi:cytochrome d ubiquinol oxidase subunit II
METVWFFLLALVLAVYVVLDGYDLGVGIIYPFVGRTRAERDAARRTVLPVWDGNEVWLIAGGGFLFFAFPRAYSAAFAGFYLAFFVLLCLLIPRGLALELRSYVDHPLWWDLCDGVFFAASLALAFVYGVALGNVLRGVPLDASGYFFVPFWTHPLRTGPNPGVFDWYTVLAGVSGVAVLLVHGAAFLAMRSVDPVRSRALAAARWGAAAAVVLPVLTVAITPLVNPVLLDNYRRRPAAFALPAAMVVTAVAMTASAWHRRGRATFLTSSLLILLTIASAAFSLHPVLLVATTGPAYDLTIDNSAASHYALTVGLVWGGVGLFAAAIYSAFAHHLFRSRHSPVPGGIGHA